MRIFPNLQLRCIWAQRWTD